MNQTEDKISYVEAAQGSVNKMGEQIAERAVNSVIEFIKKKYGNACVNTGKVFEKYLVNSKLRYNKIKTLADLSEPRNFEGENGIYVDVFVQYRERKISLDSIDDLMKINNNIIIVGSGGMGKSIIMRHLFLNTNNSGKYIPVLIQLRNIEDVERDEALFDLIHSCIEDFDVKLNQVQFEYSLKSGKYLLLFDGLDEVESESRGRTEHLIQKLSKKYPNNCYVVSSREEGINFSELETFTIVKSCLLEKKQAVELVLKIGKYNKKINEFAKLLDEQLYEKHYDFASNPLLLTMMYITFIDNNMIPEHIIDFYENAYGALYKRHDANKEGLFDREYKCNKMGEREFKNLFSYFCFQSFFAQKYEFSKMQLLEYINRGITRLGYNSVLDSAENFFDDIKDIVCLIVEEGTKYKFAHRSFQMYFAAYYTVVQVTDEQQKNFMRKQLENRHYIPYDYYEMLYHLEGERFNRNVLEPGIDEIVERMNASSDSSVELLKIFCQCLGIEKGEILRVINSAEHMEIPYERNVLMLYEHVIASDISYNKEFAFKIEKIVEDMRIRDISNDAIYDIEIEEICSYERCDLRDKLLNYLCQYWGIYTLKDNLIAWKEKQKEKKKKEMLQNDVSEILLVL